MAVISRYSSLRTFEDSKGNTYSGRYKRVSKDKDYYSVTVLTPTTFDLLAAQHYGTSVLYWMIADFNDYLDPSVTIPAGTVIKIPRM